MATESRFEALVQVLLVARKGATKSEILDRSSLTPTQVEQCLCFLQQKDFLRKRGRNNMFDPTSKGARIIVEYERINQRIG